ncbi:MAG: hypothetical protein FK734_09330 [Asgard group archaeon]|nr:hypothetical protein [Asgard group archaeon]
MSDSDYKSTYQALSFYSIGGLWGYAIIRLIDSNGEEKVRLAKCKKKQEFPNTKKYTWEDVPTEQMANLSQVQKINFKPTDNFQTIADKIIEELGKVQPKEKKDGSTEESEETDD